MQVVMVVMMVDSLRLDSKLRLGGDVLAAG